MLKHLPWHVTCHVHDGLIAGSTLGEFCEHLFEKVDRTAAAAVIEAYAHLGASNKVGLPAEAAMPEPKERLARTYPLHPKLLEMLTEKTASPSNIVHPHPINGVFAGLIFNGESEHLVPNHAFTELIALSGERVLGYIGQRGLTLTRAPKRSALENVAHSLPDLNRARCGRRRSSRRPTLHKTVV